MTSYVGIQLERINMRKKSDEVFGAIAVALLLIITAWGNALAMLIVSGLGLIAAIIFRRRLLHGGALIIMVVGCVVSGLLAAAITVGLTS